MKFHGTGSMLIETYLRTIYVPSRIEIALQYEKKLYSVVAMFSEHIGRPALLKDLSTLNVCSFLAAYRKKWSARSTNNQRQALLSIWRDASDRPGFLPLLSATPNYRQIRKLPEELDPPEAWTKQQIVSLIKMAQKQTGRVGDITAADWWLSLYLSIYWTSCRITSMLSVPSSAFDGTGILVRKQKNHRPQRYPLPQTCCEAIERTNPQSRKMLWQHPWHPRTVWTKARQIIEAAGLPAPMTGRQLFHRLRRTTITLCAMIDSAVAQRTAGHQSYATTLKHYIDPRIVSERSAADILPDPLAETPIYETKTPKFRIYG